MANGKPNKPVLRRLERELVGQAMAVLAWLLEKALLRAMRRGVKS